MTSISPDGSDRREHSARFSGPLDFDWSPDGTRLAATISEEISVAGLDDDILTEITVTPFGAFQPNWSSDNEWIAFVTDNGTTTNVAVVRGDGSSQRILTDSTLTEYYGYGEPEWAPNEMHIAYTALTHAEIIDLSGHLLWSSPVVDGVVQSVSWSPDGNEVLLLVSPLGGPVAQGDIYLWQPAISLMRRLTTDAAANHGIGSPAWSPDGSKIVFASSIDGDYDLYQVDIDTGAMGTITETRANEYDPSWSPDGSHLVYVSSEFGARDLVISRFDGSEAHRITDDIRDNRALVWSN